jgi:23S rRNA pseudouridine2605 synthase
MYLNMKGNGMRIAKFIADSGLCSRREAERWIEDGRVEVDGEVLSGPALNIEETNIVKVDGKLVRSAPEPKLWVYYKPLGLITTNDDPQGRETIFEQLKELPRVVSVGRLDVNSEGILLLTNNGELSRYFEKPDNKIERTYKVRVYGRGREIDIENKKVIADGVIYRPKSIKLTQKKGANSWYEVVLTEGKNREIRKIFEHFGFEVSRLIRTSFGKYKLGSMNPGEFKEVKIYENYRWKV